MELIHADILQYSNTPILQYSFSMFLQISKKAD